MAEVAIVGSGVGGLSAAIDLASRGHDVAVYEAASEAGGKLGRTMVAGVEADTGPTVLTMPETFDSLFRAAGTSLEAELELVTHDELFDLRWPDGATLVVHRAPERTLVAVSEAFGAAAGDDLRAFLAYAKEIWETVAPAFVFGEAPTLSTLLSLGLRDLRALRRIDSMRSMRAAIEQFVREPHVRDLLMRYATYNGSDPRTAPATLNCIAHLELTLGCYGIRGGMYVLASALETVARRLGVQFHFDTPVHSIVRERGRIVGIDIGRSVVADAVVANADVSHVFGDLLRGESARNTAPSMSAWTGLVRTKRQKRLGHGVLFPAHYEQEFADIFDRGAAPRSPSVYVCSQETAHGRVGMPRDEVLFVMANAPTATHGLTDVSELTELTLSRLRRVEWIGPDASIVWERTPAELATRFPGTRGAIYGPASNSKLAAFHRASNRVRRLPGLYLASGSAHPGGGLPLCALSGRAAARAVAEDLQGTQT